MLNRYLKERKDILNKIFIYIKNKEYDKLDIIKEFCKYLDVEFNDKNIFALANRLINLEEDLFNQTIGKEKKYLAYQFVANFWHKEFIDTISFIKKHNLLNDFNITILSYSIEIGKYFNQFFISKDKYLEKFNKELLENFNSKQELINFLKENNLIEKYNNDFADRTYSVLVIKENNLEIVPFIEKFDEIKEISKLIEELLDELLTKDDIYKWEYINYFQKLLIALNHKNINTLVNKWADVDRAWMDINSNIHIAHMFEYYEDNIRNSVSSEFDIRLIVNKIDFSLNFYLDFYNNLDIKNDKVIEFSIKNLKKTKAFIARPLLFFGSHFNGLFSAQVLPNDEIISKEKGKKIFAFSEDVLETLRAKPFTKLHKSIYPKEFLDKYKDFINSDTWYKIYNISTIGHEFGHILWVDDDSEVSINSSGEFKNIEEFKATTSGLVNFFYNEESDLIEPLLIDLIYRSISLIGWMEINDVKAYYIEGLIHLTILFQSNILKFNQKLLIDFSNYNKLKQNYIKVYTKLVKLYLKKEDAKIFLDDFVANNLPKDKEVLNFVNYYYQKYKELASVI